MKRILFITAVAALGMITTSTYAQMGVAILNQFSSVSTPSKEIRKEARELRRMEVSYSTREGFARDFPDATNVAFQKGQGMDEVRFTENNVDFTAFYDEQGELIGTTTEKKFDEIPLAAQKSIYKHYPEYLVNKVIMFDDNEYNDSDMTLYEQEFEDQDNYFVELSKPGKTIILMVNMEGNVTFFHNL